MRSRRALTLREYLRQKHVNYAQLAREIGVTRQAIELWAKGKRTPRLDLALRLSRATGLPVENLLNS